MTQIHPPQVRARATPHPRDSWAQFESLARRGQWDQVNPHIRHHTAQKDIEWMMQTLAKEQNRHMRILAAKMLHTSGANISPENQAVLKVQMKDEMEYLEVRLRIAIALHLRENYDDDVSDMVRVAMMDPSVTDAAVLCVFS